MKILKAKVDWRDNYDVVPEFQVLVDEVPKDLTYTVEKVGAGALYFTCKDDYVDFLFSDPNDKNGFGGREFKLNTKDGQVSVIGPWSSRVGVVNKLGLCDCVKVAMTDDPKVFERGYTFFVGYITLDLAREATKISGVKLLKETYNNGEVYYIPAIPDCSLDEVSSEWSSFDEEVLKAIKGKHYYRNQERLDKSSKV